MRSFLLAAVAAASLVPIAAQAGTISGQVNGLDFVATSNIIGQTSTATGAGGGNPIYFAQMPKYSGVVTLIMNEGAAGNFICSGTLLNDRRSVLTAGHCVSHGAGTANPIATTAYFYGGANPDTVVWQDPASTAVAVSQYFVNSGYSGEVIDQNDIAVVRLAEAAPLFATSYGVYNGGDLTGQDYNIAGYGGRSNAGGSVGVNLGTGRLRQGDNRYDFRFGDSDFAFDGGWHPGDFGESATTQIDYSYLADFDNGLAAQDSSCRLAGLFAAAGGGVLGGPKYCNLGRGATEVSTAGGDSGGPQFINGMISSVTSYGLTFGTGVGDIDGKLNDTFGEFNGFVPTFIHTDFINGAMVPEPASWALMIVGFGLTGAAARRNRRRAVIA
ncbi:PEPxxWA-CTERM sorting domain-containing protein [Phenylobacterium sp.]|uniref:PEPxxWA-CTERM sorting domain-containing protein n=1 Tax=Phenylobacterium sp. TaxID=1871053 RepID=UPI00374D3F97